MCHVVIMQLLDSIILLEKAYTFFIDYRLFIAMCAILHDYPKITSIFIRPLEAMAIFSIWLKYLYGIVDIEFINSWGP